MCPCNADIMTAEHILQHCQLIDALRWDMWPEPITLRVKFYDNLEELRRTASFVRATGISVWRTTTPTKKSTFFNNSPFNILRSLSPLLNLIYPVLELLLLGPICFADISTTGNISLSYSKVFDSRTKLSAKSVSQSIWARCRLLHDLSRLNPRLNLFQTACLMA